ncbi:hypothetical protein ZIOFF_055456 [Zingiber officinale]|uniref:mannan endo-1,4-beta-mannosidase n=1 Tax=Zingiber officinale TaxID=94328 RepID=A0A8J5KSB7_ZINOF|nr:hypothetical protein ZIOFF_055456 [Zingiber officinale]
MEGRHRPVVAREFVMLLLLLLLGLSASGFGATAVYGGGGVGFVRRNGTQFVVDAAGGGRKPLEGINGFNAYWLMYKASFPEERWKVRAAFRDAAAHGLTVVRTWAFRDGGFRPLQASPGVYNEDVFQGLDYVISEASKYKIRLILSLVNNFDSFGGRRQYIEWAREAGHCLSSDDDFYTDNIIKDYYKNHVKAILTRVNTINGLSYKDDPAIFAWELINEPRCVSDLSGITLQGWIEEMVEYVKSIDDNHMLEVGLEGFYGESTPNRKKFNLIYDMGTDFISNNLVKGIDFATVHVYPDEWMPWSTNQTQMAFLDGWLRSHIADADAVLSMPLLVSEFGKKHSPASSSSSNGRRRSRRKAVGDERQSVYASVYDAVYASASGGGACRGGLFWQLLLGEEAMDDMRDGYEVVFSESPFLEHLIDMQSRRLNNLSDYRPCSMPRTLLAKFSEHNVSPKSAELGLICANMSVLQSPIVNENYQ